MFGAYVAGNRKPQIQITPLEPVYVMDGSPVYRGVQNKVDTISKFSDASMPSLGYVFQTLHFVN